MLLLTEHGTQVGEGSGKKSETGKLTNKEALGHQVFLSQGI